MALDIDLGELTDVVLWMRAQGVRCLRHGPLELDLADEAPVAPSTEKTPESKAASVLAPPIPAIKRHPRESR